MGILVFKLRYNDRFITAIEPRRDLYEVRDLETIIFFAENNGYLARIACFGIRAGGLDIAAHSVARGSVPGFNYPQFCYLGLNVWITHYPLALFVLVS